MSKKKDKIGRIETGNNFKLTEKNAKNSPVKNVDWEGQEIGVESDTKLESDLGTGQAIIIRFFEFGANPDTFKTRKPTAQELFNSHWKGIEAMLWRDELKPFEAVEPKLMFSKNGLKYRFIITCIPRSGSVLIDKPKTLTQLLAKSPQ